MVNLFRYFYSIARDYKPGKDSILNSIRKETGVDRRKLNRYWDEAIKQTNKQIEQNKVKFKKESDEYYAYVTGIVKRRAKNAMKK